MSISIRLFSKADWMAVSTIYDQGIRTRNATFETQRPDYETWIKKFHPHLLWVAENDNTVVGWAGLQPVSPREVYKGVVEVTIYIDSQQTGKGIGRMLLSHLITESENSGVWTLYASIFPENIASIKLHESAGFRKIGFREKIARMDGKWRDTVLFERRSRRVGV